MGIIAGVLFAAGYIQTFYVPFWVELAAYSAISLGTLAGGWRIIHTMGSKITKLQPVGGFAAETGAAMAILIATVSGVPVSTTGIDGYTLTKVESEQLALEYVGILPMVVLRPGFIYGPRDRTVLPRLLERLRTGQFAYLGSRDKMVNNTFVGNLVEAVFLAIATDAAVGRVYNITDGRLVSKKEFMGTIARLAGYPEPTKTVPIGVARALTTVLEGTWKMLGKTEAPILSQARLKMLGLNLDYSCAKARREIGYNPEISFERAMQTTIDWFRQQNML